MFSHVLHLALLFYPDDLARHVQHEPRRNGTVDKLDGDACLEEEPRWHNPDVETRRQIAVREHVDAAHAESAREGIRPHLQ
jgi:hypothetical protein